jgi:hypothetical protein
VLAAGLLVLAWYTAATTPTAGRAT